MRALDYNGTVHTLAWQTSPKLAGRRQHSLGTTAGCTTQPIYCMQAVSKHKTCSKPHDSITMFWLCVLPSRRTRWRAKRSSVLAFNKIECKHERHALSDLHTHARSSLTMRRAVSEKCGLLCLYRIWPLSVVQIS